MNNMFRLALILFKGNGISSLGSDSRRKKKRTIGSQILFIVFGAYMLLIMAGSSDALYSVLAPSGLQGLMTGLYLSAGTVLVFLFGILYVISIFYHAGDIEKLLPLPLRASEIIGAKLIVTALWEYIYLAFLVLPPLVVYGLRSEAGFWFFFWLVPVFLLLPVVPLSLASILVMLIMRFTPLARNKDRFNMISGLLAMVLALAFVFGSQSMTTLSETDLAGLISSGAESVARLTTTLFPGASFAVQAMTASSPARSAGQAALLFLSAALAVWLTMTAARFLYFKGVIGIQSSMARRSKLSAAQLQEAGKSRPAWLTYMQKDLRILVRTPIFFMNNVLMNFLWPFFIVFPLLAGQGGDMNPGALIGTARQLLSEPGSPAARMAVVICFGAACFVSGTNGITESALSREGRMFYIMKIIPMSGWHQLLAKIATGVLFSLAGALLPAIIFLAVVRPPAWLGLSLLVVVPGAVLMTNAGGMFFDLFWPKLNWDNEQKAVKQNLNVLYGMVLAMVLAAVLVLPAILLGWSLLPSVLMLGGGSLVLAAVELYVLRQISAKQIAAIEPA